MQICRFGLIWAILCAAIFVNSAAAQKCGGCLDGGCLGCGPLSGKDWHDPFDLPFGVHPPAILGTATFELVALERSGADSQDILFAGVNPVANATDLNFIPELGFRLDLVLPSDCGCDFNINVFGSGHDYAGLFRNDPGITFRWFGAAPAVPAPAYTVEYISDLKSLELNIQTREWPRFSPMVGFRVLRLEEDFNILTAANTGFFTNVINDLYGFQIGGQMLLWQRNRLRLETKFKTGVYYNNMGLRATASNNELLRNSSHAAFVGEANLTLVYQFAPRLAFKAGYQGLWLGGVGLAPDQSDDGSFATDLVAFDSGKVSYQGGLLGFELTW